MRILYVLPKLSNGGVEKMAEKWIMYLTRKDNIQRVYPGYDLGSIY